MSDPGNAPKATPKHPMIDVESAIARAEATSMSFRVRVRRQEGPQAIGSRRRDEFRVAWRPGLTVHDCLESIRRDPVDTGGRRVAPPSWEASCLEGRCGACSMRIDGRARQACTTLVDPLLLAKGAAVLELAPLAKLPVLRDLVVDRSRVRTDLERVRAWVELDATTQQASPSRRVLAPTDPAPACTGCAACLDACPEVHPSSDYVGAASIHAAHLALSAAPDRASRAPTLDALAGPGGVAQCGRARNCVEVCPAGLALDESIGAAARATNVHVLTSWLRRR